MRNSLLVALINASSAHRKRTRQEFQKMDLSEGQPKVLAYLDSNEGCLQKELAERCNVEPATMTVLLRNMANKDLIQKKAVHVSCGKRAFGIYLTELGHEKARKAIAVMEDMELVSYTGFSEADKDTLIALLQRVTDNLTE